jgi:3-oxoacyl-[acyl-carrier protein] reductase
LDLGITGKTALITASSRGLGFASALALAREGVNVTICARGEAILREAETRLREIGVAVLAVPIDLTLPDAPTRLVETTVEFHGSLDILVANAGGPPVGRSLEVDDEALTKALNENLMASVRLVRGSVPHMQERQWGRICAITSFSVLQPIPELALSNTARSGLLAWARTAADDLAPDGITLNIACPGLHATERAVQLGADLDAAGDPEDFGRVVSFLCSQQSAGISGLAIPVDGGASALAWLA